MQSIEPGISRFRVWSFEPVRNDGVGRNDEQEETKMTLAYPVASNAAHPAPLSPAYTSSIKRAPQKPLIPMRHTLSELTGPVSSESVWRIGKIGRAHV